MRPIAEYVADLRALGKAIVAISVDSECDDASGWWEVNAMFERSPEPSPRSRWIEHEHFESYLVEMPPGEIDAEERKRSGSLIIRHEPSYSRLPLEERDAVERQASTALGEALAAALGVSCYVTPPEVGGIHLSWLHQQQCEKLVRRLEAARHVVIVSGRDFAPIGSKGSSSYAELLDSDNARLRHWTEKVRTWDEMESWKSVRHHRSGGDPYVALPALDRRGNLEGVIVETPFGHLQSSGLSQERVAEIHGSLAEVECLSCSKAAPAAPAIESFRIAKEIPRCSCGGFLKLAVTAWGQKPKPEAIQRARGFADRADLVLVLGSPMTTEPCRSIVLEPVRSRGTPLVIVGHGATNEDAAASLIIEGSPEHIMLFAVRALR